MKLVGRGVLTDRAAELADVLLNEAVDATAGVGLVSEVDFGTAFQEEMCPDELIPLGTVPPPPPPSGGAGELLRLHLPLLAQERVAAFAPDRCEALFGTVGAPPSALEGPTQPEAGEEAPPTLRLLNPPRRARIGSELPMKVYPAAAMLGRWLFRHQELLHGQDVLEIGAGVGTAGLAAAAGGARRVVLTDVSAPALKCAKENCMRQGDAPYGARIAAAACVAPLDWAEPPIAAAEAGAIDGSDAEESGGACSQQPPAAASEAEALLYGQFDVILAADVINDLGLSELVYRVVELYLKPHGVLLMLCPKAEHRYAIDRFRAMISSSTDFETAIADVPPWLHEGLGEVNETLADEAAVVRHELIVAQWKGGRRPSNSRSRTP